MKNLNNYIFEKFRIKKNEDKDIYPDFNSWAEYIESIGGKVVEMNEGVYIICLERSDIKVSDAFSDQFYTYPYFKIETVENDKAWEPYLYENEEFIVYTKYKKNTVKYSYKTDKLVKYTDNSYKESIFNFSKDNADYILEILESLYENN